MSESTDHVRGSASRSNDEGPPELVAFWHSKTTVGLIAAVIALSAPLVTGVAGIWKVKVSEIEQSNAMQLAFFEKAIDPAQSSVLRLSVLKFLAQSPRIDSDVRDWAEQEIPAVSNLVAKEAAAKQNSVAAEWSQYNQLQQAVPHNDPEATRKAHQALQAQRDQIDKLTREAMIAEQAATATSRRPGERCSKARLRDTLHSGVDEGQAARRCQATASLHDPGETWIERWGELAFQCECPADKSAAAAPN